MKNQNPKSLAFHSSSQKYAEPAKPRWLAIYLENTFLGFSSGGHTEKLENYLLSPSPFKQSQYQLSKNTQQQVHSELNQQRKVTSTSIH